MLKYLLFLEYFRSICTNQGGLGYENTSFKFLKIDEYIEGKNIFRVEACEHVFFIVLGGDKEIYHRNGER